MEPDEAKARYERLSQYLEADPDNVILIADYAQAALDADETDAALMNFQRLDAIEPLVGVMANTAGIAAMRSGDQFAAQSWFSRVYDENPDDVGVRFNIAWSKALARDFEGAVALLNPDVINALPQAAMLDLQIAHELGHFDEATEKLENYLIQFGEYAPLQAAASVLAMDVDRPDLARASAEKAGDHPDALTTLATLDLGDRKLDEAKRQFEKALAMRPMNPRAEIGLGLIDLAEGNANDAVTRLDKGAEQFGDHLGSWIAAGWAHFIGGDLNTARDRFETAIRHDDTFGEAQGSLAVIELLQGDIEAATRRMVIARRLDRESFSGALAATLLEQSRGNQEKAEQIFKRALAQPILPNGSTLMDELVKALGRT